MLTICTEWTDAYWLCKTFASLLDEHFSRRTTIAAAIVEIKQQLSTVHHIDFQQFHNDHLSTQLPIELWLRTAGATLFSRKALEKYGIYMSIELIISFRLWDKICTGEGVTSLCITVIVEMLAMVGTDVMTAIDSESSALNIDELMRRILSSEIESKIVLRTFESMNRSGRFYSRRSDTKLTK